MPKDRQSLSIRYRSALVTGASSGLGKAIANALLDEGLTVYGTTRDIRQPNLHPQVKWLAFEGNNDTLVIDWIRDQGRLLDKIDILVNNCGSGIFGDILQESASESDENRQLLLGTPIALTNAVLKGMRTRGGLIVNISSLAAQFPLPYMASYTSAKAGLSAFTQSLMLTELGSGVVLVDFQPGDFRTAFNRNMVQPDTPGKQEAAVWQQVEKHLISAPLPESGAKDLIQFLRRGRSGVARSGGFFQTRIAPFGIRFLPRRWLLGCIRRYYHLKRI